MKIQEQKYLVYMIQQNNDFNLNMWSSTKAEDIKSSLKRLEKIKLSKTANEILRKNFIIIFISTRRNDRRRIC